MECVTSTSCSISLNNRPYGHFLGKRGLRQGDPISPFLFVIDIEYLLRLLWQLHQDREFHFHAGYAEQNITHLSFADDLILFSRGDACSVQRIMEALNIFGECLGPTCANLSSSMRELAKTPTGCSSARGSQPELFLLDI